ncbi:hypothetical protein yc1106_08531 [Curvularia clavata]|uniref:C2H2-type domain-containing protein n=1 Tax=Curvularia clavata TaxID=95742 RepID=A0A9Q8ZFX9_CURCL|nr:hypothetical protein yc1106_08531 [Curvularia clavata]
MAPPKLPGGEFGCALCGFTFDTKTELINHTATHYNRAPTHREHYKLQGLPGITPQGAIGLGLSREPDYPYRGYVDLDKPKDNDSTIVMYDDLADDSRLSTNANENGLRCKDCKKQFKSQAQYNNHFLACTPVASPFQAKPAASASSGVLRAKPLNTMVPFQSVSSKRKDTFNTKAQVSKPKPLQKAKPNPEEHKQLQQHHAAPAPFAPSVANTDRHFCNVKGCDKSFRSDAGLTQHKKDVHGIGGRKLDLEGRDSWMLGSRRGSPASSRAPSLTVHKLNISKPNHLFGPAPQVPQSHKPAAHPAAHQAVMQMNTNIGSIADIEQAKEIHHRALRLLIQSDIFIRPGSIVVDDISWSRVPCANQGQLLNTLDTMCHLPKQLQGEYLPGPKTFKDEQQASYSLAEFTSFSARDPGKPGLGAVVLICSKVALSDDRQEVVKIAAVDCITGAIIMNHLVCTDPQLSVTDWRSSVTGLSSWHDMEAARQAGYKVFKGWLGARAALGKYVDSETIILGYNLRADLDILRIMHGRGVDIVKVVEKAGNGAFAKQQLALDSLCRDTTIKVPGVYAKHGRDPLMDAFAVRELFLWAIKNQKGLETMAKKRVADYQNVQVLTKRTGGT